MWLPIKELIPGLQSRRREYGRLSAQSPDSLIRAHRLIASIHRPHHAQSPSASSWPCTIISPSAISTTSSSRPIDDSYRPFLDVFSRYPSLKMSLHISGSLMEWLDAHHPEYLDRLAELVDQRADRDHRRGLFRADPGDDSLARPHRPDPQLHPLAAKPPGGHRPRHVDARARLGTVASPATWSTPASNTPCSTIPLQVRRPGRVATVRPLADRGRRPDAVGVPRQRAAPLH